MIDTEPSSEILCLEKTKTIGVINNGYIYCNEPLLGTVTHRSKCVALSSKYTAIFGETLNGQPCFSPEPQSLTQCCQKRLHSAADIKLNITAVVMQEERGAL